MADGVNNVVIGFGYQSMAYTNNSTSNAMHGSYTGSVQIFQMKQILLQAGSVLSNTVQDCY